MQENNNITNKEQSNNEQQNVIKVPDIVEIEDYKVVEESKRKRKFSLSVILLEVILPIMIILWIGICVIDYINVNNNKDAIFCIKKDTTTYKDGVVYNCTGLGYKVYRYDRLSFNGIEFGPIWLKDRTKDN